MKKECFAYEYLFFCFIFRTADIYYQSLCIVIQNALSTNNKMWNL